MLLTEIPPQTQNLADIHQVQHRFFRSGQTRPLAFRMAQLEKLREAIRRFDQQILKALHQDFRKSAFEGYATEVGFVLDELRFVLKHLPQWVQSEKVKTPMVHQPASSQIIPEPYGVALIIGPWNYPFNLAIAPLIGAIAAGNCAILKPSEFTPHTSKVLAEIIRTTFDPAYVTVVEGGVEATQALLDQPFDYLFFTGSPQVGRIVMEKAAKHLTPLTLELGGKSPCIVDMDVDLEVTARRIVWGKFVNAGQTCVAPDYLLVPKAHKPGLFYHLKAQIKAFYGENPRQSPDLARIITPRHFERLCSLLNQGGKLITGGETDAADCYIAPTILDEITWDDPIMQDEIFGPILPVLTYESLDEVIERVNAGPRPLALYFFSNNTDNQEKILEAIPFGGGCINDTLIHLGNPHLPFGGVGSSGMGAYHGKYSFETFTHYKGIVTRPFKMDVKLRYPPYNNLKEKIVRQVIK